MTLLLMGPGLLLFFTVMTLNAHTFLSQKHHSCIFDVQHLKLDHIHLAANLLLNMANDAERF